MEDWEKGRLGDWEKRKTSVLLRFNFVQLCGKIMTK
jgi:hypothetical protein